MKARKLSLSEAANKMADLTLSHLAALKPVERKKQTKAFKALAAEAASRVRRNRSYKPSLSLYPTFHKTLSSTFFAS